jgi:hypothetical protein
VYFINKQYIVRFKIGKQTGKVGRFFNYRAAGFFYAHAQLVGYNPA